LTGQVATDDSEKLIAAPNFVVSSAVSSRLMQSQI